MTSQIAPRASGPRPVVAKLLAVSLLALSACSKDEARSSGSGSGTTGTFTMPP